MKLKKLQSVDYLVVHCSATPATSDIGVKEIDQWHRKRGWLKVGYHLIIRRNGTIENGRSLDEQGAHVSGHNHNSIGICMVGGGDGKANDRRNFTKQQFESLEMVLRSLKAKFPNATILGHRDLSPDKNGDGVIQTHEWVKECPTFDVKPWLKDVGLG